MANTIITDRTQRAQGIVARKEVIKLAAHPGEYVVSDAATGSGNGHITTLDTCDCPDRRFRKNVCKHMRALRIAAGGEICPTCGEQVVDTVFYCGGTGNVAFKVCPTNIAHYGRKFEGV